MVFPYMCVYIFPVYVYIYLFISSVFRQFFYENIMEDSTESPTTVETKNIQCSPLIHQAPHLIIEGY